MRFRLGEMQGLWYNGRQEQLIDVKECGCEEHLEVLLKYPDKLSVHQDALEDVAADWNTTIKKELYDISEMGDREVDFLFVALNRGNLRIRLYDTFKNNDNYFSIEYKGRKNVKYVVDFLLLYEEDLKATRLPLYIYDYETEIGKDFKNVKNAVSYFLMEESLKSDKTKLFEVILNETKVNAYRHHTKEEAEAVVAAIKDSIKRYKFDIINRDKNLDFMHKEGIDKKGSMYIIEKFLEPRSLIAVVQNRNNPDEELYVFSIMVPVRDKKRYIYLKVSLRSDGVVKAISWHGQTEMMHPDYRMAVDKTDGDNKYFFRKMFQNWQRVYNKFNDNKMLDVLPNGSEDVTIVFEHQIEDTEEWRKNFCKTVPKDYGYHYKDIEKNMKLEGDCVRLHLNIGRF